MGQAVAVCGVPAGAMFFGGLLSRVGSPHVAAVHALQHLGAGIVLGAVSTELLPLLLTRVGRQGLDVNAFTAATCAGFVLGLVLMLGVRGLTQRASEAPEVPSEAYAPLLGEGNGAGAGAGAGGGVAGGVAGGGAPAEAAGGGADVEEAGSDGELFAEPVYDSVDAAPRPERVREALRRGTFGRHAAWSAYSEAQADRWDRDVSWGTPFPWTFTVAVAVDSVLDGVLIGLALASAGATAGWAMAAALAFEMGFLGLTYAVAVSRQGLPTQMACAVGMPLAILAGGAAGAFFAQALEDHPAAFVAALSFGVAALLYLCAEELLLEGHVDCGRGHTWWVDLCFFAGFLAVFVTSVREA